MAQHPHLEYLERLQPELDAMADAIVADPGGMEGRDLVLSVLASGVTLAIEAFIAPPSEDGPRESSGLVDFKAVATSALEKMTQAIAMNRDIPQEFIDVRNELAAAYKTELDSVRDTVKAICENDKLDMEIVREDRLATEEELLDLGYRMQISAPHMFSGFLFLRDDKKIRCRCLSHLGQASMFSAETKDITDVILKAKADFGSMQMALKALALKRISDMQALYSGNVAHGSIDTEQATNEAALAMSRWTNKAE